jgi:hypothetical protein
MDNLTYTNKEQDNFLNKCDPDLVIEIHEEQMLPEDLDFNEFLVRYQKKHLAKYGYQLSIKLE